MINVTISNVGVFTIHQEKLQELLNWLSRNGVRTQNLQDASITEIHKVHYTGTNTQYTGQSLING